jgi:hypothetical protein
MLLAQQSSQFAIEACICCNDEIQKRKADAVGRCMHDLFDLDLTGSSHLVKAMYQSAQQKRKSAWRDKNCSSCASRPELVLPNSIPAIWGVAGHGLVSRWFCRETSWASSYPFIVDLHPSHGRTPFPFRRIVLAHLRPKLSSHTRTQPPLHSVV